LAGGWTLLLSPELAEARGPWGVLIGLIAPAPTAWAVPMGMRQALATDGSAVGIAQ